MPERLLKILAISAVSFCGIAVIILCLFFFGFARALSPKRGTLEWIALYDRPGVQLSGSGAVFRPIELLPCFLAALCSAALYIVCACLQIGSFAILSTETGRTALLNGASIFAATSIGAFALSRSLFGSLPLSFLCAILCALEYGADYIPAMCLVWLLFFLHRWMCAHFDAPASGSFGYLALFASASACSLLLDPHLLSALAVLWIVMLIILGLRFHNTHRFSRLFDLISSVLFFSVIFFFSLLLFCSVLEWLACGKFDFLLERNFYLSALFGHFRLGSIPLPTFYGVNFLLLLTGLTATAFSLYDALRYGTPDGVLLTGGACSVLVLWLIGARLAFGSALIPSICYVIHRSRQRGARMLSAIGCTAAVIVSVLSVLVLLLLY